MKLNITDFSEQKLAPAILYFHTEMKEKKLYLANPIYDTVFKYLMEDERIARTILSEQSKKLNEQTRLLSIQYSDGMLAQGMNISTIASMLGLSEEQVTQFQIR